MCRYSSLGTVAGSGLRLIICYHEFIIQPARNVNTPCNDLVQEHHYHELECRLVPRENEFEVILPDPDAPELPPPFKAESTPPPIYHDISDLPNKGAQVRQNEYTNCILTSGKTD